MILSETTDARYQIVKILGQGGSADVFLARHLALGELRVLKVLHQDMVMDGKRRTKFFLEAQLAAHLKHPAIVPIYDVTQTGHKLQIEMEYIDGWSLRQLLEQRKQFPQPVALATVVGILEGLDHAHTATLTFDGVEYDGVIHRDLKPENILVRKSGQPVICDFGVAKLGADLLSMTQNISGSVAYMAPERLRGEVSTRSIDIFAMGVMLFELVKGYRPFPSRNQPEAIESLLQWRVVDLGSELQDCDEAILQVIRKSMAKESHQRYQNASQMLDALRPLYRLYHGEAKPSQVLHAYLTTGQFTTSEFRALLHEDGGRPKRWAIFAIGATALALLLMLVLRNSPEPSKRLLPSLPADSARPVDYRVFLSGGDFEGAKKAVQNLPLPADRQNGYFTIAQAYLDRTGDAGNALLMAHKALEFGFHPTIAALRARIYLDQDMPNMAKADLKQIEPWLGKMTPSNQALCHWLRARLELGLMAESSATLKTRGNKRAVEAIQNYLRLDPGNELGHHDAAKAALKRLGAS